MAGTEAEATEKQRTSAQSLASGGFLSLLFYTTQNHLPSHYDSQSGLGPPTSIINQENAPKDTLRDQSDEGNSSIEAPYFHMTLACTK